jgi:hypothetical protein
VNIFTGASVGRRWADMCVRVAFPDYARREIAFGFVFFLSDISFPECWRRHESAKLAFDEFRSDERAGILQDKPAIEFCGRNQIHGQMHAGGNCEGTHANSPSRSPMLRRVP